MILVLIVSALVIWVIGFYAGAQFKAIRFATVIKGYLGDLGEQEGEQLTVPTVPQMDDWESPYTDETAGQDVPDELPA